MARNTLLIHYAFPLVHSVWFPVNCDPVLKRLMIGCSWIKAKWCSPDDSARMLTAAQYVRCACEAKILLHPCHNEDPGSAHLDGVPITIPVCVSSVTCWCQSCGRVWCRRRWSVAIWKLLTVGADRFNIPAAAAFFDGCSDSARYCKVSEKSPRLQEPDTAYDEQKF